MSFSSRQEDDSDVENQYYGIRKSMSSPTAAASTTYQAPRRSIPDQMRRNLSNSAEASRKRAILDSVYQQEALAALADKTAMHHNQKATISDEWRHRMVYPIDPPHHKGMDPVRPLYLRG